jgi:outer membrane protein OmpA-like peptidoglycan-associated protein
MTEPGLAPPPGGATLHRLSPARVALAVGLCALGIGALAVIHRVLLPRYFAEGGATRVPAAAVHAAPVAEAAPAGEGAPAPVAVVVPAGEPPAAPVAVPPPPAPAVVAVTPPAAQPLPPVAVPPPPTPAVVAVTPPAPPPPPVPAAPEPAPVPAKPAPAESAPSAAEAPTATGPAEELPDLLFAINATWLSRASRETLDKVVAALEADASRRVVLSGHTDAAGPSDLNRALARARARRASRYLQAHGIDPSRVEIQSFGSERPAADATPGTMRARNRRVEIAIE